MKRNARSIVRMGDLVAAVFDSAEQYSVDPLVVSRLATRALGSLPVFAFSVIPPAAGLILANRLRSALVIAVGLGVAAGGLGYLAAFVYSLPVGASQAALCVLFALVAYGWARVRR